ncbi:hypothetical protein [Streptomyces sp. ITFR-6]|uniref:hypothetical protein n=1 Tax=Streptomyces sp. ITFR-6 TaxID=3075197 RepID=UPI0028894CAF|nr:hypothetical protein [Streptomyces sp. ITFR-6]WNI33566.1 hypothetical protein RLT59_35795 [Streptomyces sp. ITFR-6]
MPPRPGRAGGGTDRGDVNITGTVHRIAAAGAHVLKFWMGDPAGESGQGEQRSG